MNALIKWRDWGGFVRSRIRVRHVVHISHHFTERKPMFDFYLYLARARARARAPTGRAAPRERLAPLARSSLLPRGYRGFFCAARTFDFVFPSFAFGDSSEISAHKRHQSAILIMLPYTAILGFFGLYQVLYSS